MAKRKKKNELELNPTIICFHSTNGYKIFCDIEDYARISQYNWYAYYRKNRGTITVHTIINDKKIYLHRFVMNVTDKNIQVDHITGNGLDVCKRNLRIVTNQQNCYNQRKPRGNYSSQYKGVYKEIMNNGYKNYEYWVAQIENKQDGKRKVIKIGRFKTEIEAAIAYNKKAKELFGEFAKLNEIKHEKEI